MSKTNSNNQEEKDIELKEENVANEQNEAPEAAQEENTDANADENAAEAEVEKTDAEKIAELEEKCNTMHNDYLRLYADFENFRKRTIKEKSDMLKLGEEKIIKGTLPLADDIERAMATIDKATDIEGIKEGINIIVDKFSKFLSENGVQVIETNDKDFDPERHEAIAKFNAGEEKKGKVIDCTQKGYLLGEKVIRYAKVVVGE